MRLEVTYLGLLRWSMPFSPHRLHTMDCVMIASNFADRRARQTLMPATCADEPRKSPPGNPVRPIPTDVPVPEPFDVPVPDPTDVPLPEPEDVPPPEPRDVPPPKFGPERDPKPRSVP